MAKVATTINNLRILYTKEKEMNNNLIEPFCYYELVFDKTRASEEMDGTLQICNFYSGKIQLL